VRIGSTAISSFLLAIAAFLPAGPAHGQTIIENSARPAAPNADRIVELKETLRITDEGGAFFFKYPFHIRIGPDGSIFVQEQEQLLKFDRAGKFVRNFFRKGQGPGEVTFIGDFIPAEHALTVQSITPPKMIWYGDDGAMIKEISLQSPIQRFVLIGRESSGFVFRSQGNPFEGFKGTDPAFVDVAIQILAWKEGTSGLDVRGSFPVEMYVIKASGGGGGMITLADMMTASAGGNRLALTHTQDYLIKIFDLEKKAVVRLFRRPYERIKFEPPKAGGMMIDGKTYTHAPRKFSSDIEALFAVDDRLWVVTSQRDKDGNPLIDVFDYDGRYLDRFYLRRPATGAAFSLNARDGAISGGFLYILERDADDMPSVVKYEIKDPGASDRGK
jgi:hypothetical protein